MSCPNLSDLQSDRQSEARPLVCLSADSSSFSSALERIQRSVFNVDAAIRDRSSSIDVLTQRVSRLKLSSPSRGASLAPSPSLNRYSLSYGDAPERSPSPSLSFSSGFSRTQFEVPEAMAKNVRASLSQRRRIADELAKRLQSTTSTRVFRVADVVEQGELQGGVRKSRMKAPVRLDEMALPGETSQEFEARRTVEAQSNTGDAISSTVAATSLFADLKFDTPLAAPTDSNTSPFANVKFDSAAWSFDPAAVASTPAARTSRGGSSSRAHTAAAKYSPSSTSTQPLGSGSGAGTGDMNGSGAEKGSGPGTGAGGFSFGFPTAVKKEGGDGSGESKAPSGFFSLSGFGEKK